MAEYPLYNIGLKKEIIQMQINTGDISYNSRGPPIEK
jgi:hypothetical protein